MVMKGTLGSVKHILKDGGYSNRIYNLDMNLEVCSVSIFTQYVNGKALNWVNLK